MEIPRCPLSADMRSICRALERMRLKPLALKRPPAKMPPAPPPSPESDYENMPPAPPPTPEPAYEKVSKPSSPSKYAHTPPLTRPRPQDPPCASLAMNLPPPPSSRSIGSSLGSASGSILDAAAILKPGTSVRVRTKTTLVLETKTIELWLSRPAVVVSAATDGRSYEVVFRGKFPPGDPFATVHVAHDLVIPEEQPPLSSRAANSSSSAANTLAAASKSLVAPRPSTGGKSLRLVHKLASEMQPPPRSTSSCATASKTSKLQTAPRPTPAGKIVRQLHSRPTAMKPKPRPKTAGKRLLSSLSLETKPASRPTTAGKSTRLLNNLMSEKEFQSVDMDITMQKPSSQITPSQRAANSTLAAASKTSKLQTTPRPKPAGKIAHLLQSRPAAMKPKPRPTTAGKSLRLLSSLLPMQPPPRSTKAGKSQRFIRNISPEMQSVPRPITAEKSMRLIRDLAPQMKKPAPRPTTAGKNISVIRKTLSEKDHQDLDAVLAARQNFGSQ